MFDIGFAELAVIFIIGLVVLGPQRLPLAVRTVSAWIRKSRNIFNEFKSDIEKEITESEVQENIQSYKKHVASIVDIDDIHAANDYKSKEVEKKSHKK